MNISNKKENPYVAKDADGRVTITPAGEQLLAKIVTDAKGPVHKTNSILSAGPAGLSVGEIRKRAV